MQGTEKLNQRIKIINIWLAVLLKKSKERNYSLHNII